MTSSFTLDSLDATRQLARFLVAATSPGDLLVLTGPLGAGKTTLTQQIGLELNSPAPITSPTYTLVHEYPTPQGTLVHIDAYRLQDANALLELGLEDYLERARLTVVEWGEGLLTVFPDAYHLTLVLDEGNRSATLVHPT